MSRRFSCLERTADGDFCALSSVFFVAGAGVDDVFGIVTTQYHACAFTCKQDNVEEGQEGYSS